jgi:hypothetical protein
VLEEIVSLPDELLLEMRGPTEEELALDAVELAEGKLSSETGGPIEGEAELDSAIGLEEGEKRVVGPTGGELSLDRTVGRADVKLPG